MKRKTLLTQVAMHGAGWPNIGQNVPLGWPISDGRLYEWHIAKPGKKPITKEDWLAERERLIAKPSWNDAPEWATHLEQCGNGWWHWSERINDEVVKWMVQGGGKIPAGHDYTKTLEARPTIKGRPFQVTPTSTIHTVLHDIKMEWRDTVEAWQVVDALHAAGYRKDVPPKAPPHG